MCCAILHFAYPMLIAKTQTFLETFLTQDLFNGNLWQGMKTSNHVKLFGTT